MHYVREGNDEFTNVNSSRGIGVCQHGNVSGSFLSGMYQGHNASIVDTESLEQIFDKWRVLSLEKLAELIVAKLSTYVSRKTHELLL